MPRNTENADNNEDHKREERFDFLIYFVVPSAVVCALAILMGSLPWLLGPTWFGGDFDLKHRLEMLGTFGDLFGALNATFSGVAFAAIYYTLRIQQKQHETQKLDLLMRKEKARLEVDEDESKVVFKTKVPGGTAQGNEERPLCDASYVRVVLNNKTRLPARGCRVFLTGFEKKKGEGDFVVVPESKLTLRLLQSTEKDDPEENQSFTIPVNVTNYFNVCSVKKEPQFDKPFGLLQVAHAHSKYRSLREHFELGCDYRFHLSVDSENAAPLAVKITVSIGETLDDIKVHHVESCKIDGEACYDC